MFHQPWQATSPHHKQCTGATGHQHKTSTVPLSSLNGNSDVCSLGAPLAGHPQDSIYSPHGASLTPSTKSQLKLVSTPPGILLGPDCIRRWCHTVGAVLSRCPPETPEWCAQVYLDKRTREGRAGLETHTELLSESVLDWESELEVLLESEPELERLLSWSLTMPVATIRSTCDHNNAVWSHGAALLGKPK